MADLLGSILGSMEKPPPVRDEQRKKAKEHQKRMEKMKVAEKEKMKKFQDQIQKRIEEFLEDAALPKYKFEHMDKVYRAIVHEVAETAGLTSFSFGQEEEDRYVMIWKKEFAPGDDELNAYKRGEDWDPEKAKQLAQMKEAQEAESRSRKRAHNQPAPKSNYKDKYQHLIGTVAAKEAAEATTTNRAYGFVPSENKRDQRTIEQVMADARAKRQKLTTDHAETASSDPQEGSHS